MEKTVGTTKEAVDFSLALATDVAVESALRVSC